eukprot:scaffold158805_cov34-Tisochrysis_lutea.AAC.2
MINNSNLHKKLLDILTTRAVLKWIVCRHARFLILPPSLLPFPCRPPRDGQSGQARRHTLEAPERGRSPDPGAHETHPMPPTDSHTRANPAWPTWPTHTTLISSQPPIANGHPPNESSRLGEAASHRERPYGWAPTLPRC